MGLSGDQVSRLVAAGVFERPETGVLVVAGSPATWERRLRVAVLRTGEQAVVSHRSAARIWDLEGAVSDVVEISVPRGHRRRPRVGLVHEIVDVDRGDLAFRQGFRITNPTRTLVDLGAVVPAQRLEVALDDAIRRGLTTDERLWETIDRLGRPGRTGVPDLRDLLAKRGDVVGFTDTGFETLLLRVLREHGLPRPTTQHEIYDIDGVFVMRFDAAYLDAWVGIEADSKRWHNSDARFEGDHEKRARAGALGWRVLGFTYHQVTRRPKFVADTVDDALRVRTRSA